MIRNLFGWLHRKPCTDQLRDDFEGDTMTAISPMSMDDATHELTEDLVPSGFSTLKYPKGTQIKEVPKDSSLRHFLFPDGKIGWVDTCSVRSLVTEKVTTSTPSDDVSSTIVAPNRRHLLGYLRYDPPMNITSGLRADWIKITVDMADKRFWNIISDSPVKPISKCSTIMELFGMEKGDKLYSINGRDYIYTLKDMSFKDDVVICHVTDIFGEDLEYDTAMFHIYGEQDALDRAIELTKESEED